MAGRRLLACLLPLLWVLHGRGHGVDWVEGEDNMPLTRPTQQMIYDHQHPNDCRAKAFLLWHFHNLTFAVDLHMLSWGLAKAMNEKKVLFLASNWKFAEGATKPGFEHFFEPITNCTWEDVQLSTLASQNADSRSIAVPDKLEWEWSNPRHAPPKPTCELLHGWDKMGVSWWRGMTTRYFIRPRSWVAKSVAVTAEAVGLHIPAHTVSMAVHTDELHDTMPFAAKLEDFFEEAENIRLLRPYVRTVFLTSRSADTLRQARAKWGSRWDVLSLPPEAPLVPPAAAGSAGQTHRQLVELFLHLKCDVFVVTRLSHVTRLMDEVRVTSGMFNRLVVALNGPPQYGKIG
eukprot:EG_transcript_13538